MEVKTFEEIVQRKPLPFDRLVSTKKKEPVSTPIMEAIKDVEPLERNLRLEGQLPVDPDAGMFDRLDKGFVGPQRALGLGRGQITKPLTTLRPRPRPITKPKRPRWDEFIDATARGTARVGAASYQAGAFMAELQPMGAPGMRPQEPLTPRQIQNQKQAAMKLRKNADFLWELSKNPALAAQNKDLASKALNLIGETIPYITATTAGYVTLGPMGGFTVGSMVEGNSAYRNALDYGVSESKAKKIGVGVGVVAGAVEAFGGRYAEQLLLKATAKLKSKMAKAGAVFGIGSIVEALEEGAQEVAAITGEETYRDVDWNERVSRTLGAMAGGGFLGGAMRGGTMAARGITKPRLVDLGPVTPPTVGKLAPRRPVAPITKPEVGITPDRVKSVAEKFNISEERARTILEKQAALRRPPAVKEKITPITEPKIRVEKPKVAVEKPEAVEVTLKVKTGKIDLSPEIFKDEEFKWNKKSVVEAMVKGYKEGNETLLARPISVVPDGKGGVDIIEGSHRAEAAKIAGFKPPIVIFESKAELEGMNAPEVDALAKKIYKAKPEAVEVVPEAKQPWEMTRKEYTGEKPQEFTQEMNRYQARYQQHGWAVEEAIEQGKLVSAEVLKDYPDLAQPVAKAEPTKVVGEQWYRNRWDSAKLGQRVSWVIQGKWITNKGNITKSGEKMSQSKWDELSPAAQNTLRKKIDTFYGREKLKAEPVKPKEPPGGEIAWETAVRQGLEKSQKKRRVVRVEQKKERSRRAGAYENTVKWLMKKGVSPEESIDRATAMLKGPLTEYQLYEGLDQFLPQETIDNAYKDIATTDRLYPYERKTVKDAFKKLEVGAVLTPGEVKLIKKWRPEFAKIAEKRVPLTVRIFANIEQALGLLKFGAAFDIQMRRQARWLRVRHPKLFARVVGRNIGAYVSEKYANKLAKEVENDPRYEDAVARGVQFLERKGKRPEQYISYWGEKIPLKIGKTYAASMRGFIDAFNWLQQQLWNYKVEHWERQGVTITEEMLHDLADFNNTFLGMAKAKTTFGRATRRVLAPVMWSPTLTWSRVRTPGMILSNKTMRIETAVSLAGYIGSGMMFMLAASFLARALGKKDPIEWDPRATDFGKIRVGNTRIDVYGDGGPYIRATAQLIFQKKKNQAGRLRRRPRLEVLKQFVRNKRAPFFDFVGKVWSGRNYYGGPAWEIPDWAKIKEEGGLKQLVARAGEKITEPKAGRIAFLIARETVQKFAPFFVQSAVEASWQDGWPLGLAAGADEFFSGQALSYKPSTYAKLQMVQDISATSKYDQLWDDLSPSQQQQLRKLVPEINAYEELLAREKLPIQEIDLREQNKVAERIRKSLSRNVREKLEPFGYRIIPGLSRRLGDFWLNDERYARYEKLASSHIEKRLHRLFALKNFSNLDITQQEDRVRKEINNAKEAAREELFVSKRRVRALREKRMLSLREKPMLRSKR